MQWIPEAKSPTGGLAAEGFYRLLGRPRLDPLTVLVRETAQNSWDARAQEDTTVDFHIEGKYLDGQQRQYLQDEVFINHEKAIGTGLEKALASPSIAVLNVRDNNTKGLGGPLQADHHAQEGVYDWVNFVLNVGAANTRLQSGGTYGFGKTISYIVSEANSVIIYSRTATQNGLESRLIACAIGKGYTTQGRLFTGRHWWGVAGQGVPLPITGVRADRMADDIGFPVFSPGDTGTNIMTIAPDFGGRTPQQAMRFIAESATWHLWPKLVTRKLFTPMRVHVSWGGEPFDVAPPEDRPPLDGFVKALQAVHTDSATSLSHPGLIVEAIECRSPKTVVGHLATLPLVHRPRVAVDDGWTQEEEESNRPAAAITGACHHVALLRTPELVVEYLEGPPLPEGGVEWAGVFRASDQHDAHFAAAEPPTHDSWNPQLLPKGRGRTIVNVGLREIRKVLDDLWAPKSSRRSTVVSSTAFVADELGHLLGYVPGRGKGRDPGVAYPSSSPSPEPKVDVLRSTPVLWEGVPSTKAVVQVTPGRDASATKLHYKLGAALDGRSGTVELDPLLSLAEARIGDDVIPLTGLQGTVILERHTVDLHFVVRRGADTSVMFEFQAEAVH